MFGAVSFAVAGYAAAVGGLYAAQRRFLYIPDRTRPEPAASGAADMAVVGVTTADGLRLESWYRPPATPRGPVLVYLHGNAGHLGYRAHKVRPFLDAGLGVLLVGYRGYGGNPGAPCEEGLYTDARAALGFLAGQGIGEDRIVLYGESLGTGVAVHMGAEIRSRAVVLEAPFTSITDLAASRFPLVPVRWLLHDRFDCRAKIGRLGTPLLVIHGDRDTVVPLRFGARLFGAAPEPKHFVRFPRAGHTDLYDHGAAQAVLDFLRGTRTEALNGDAARAAAG